MTNALLVLALSLGTPVPPGDASTAPLGSATAPAAAAPAAANKPSRDPAQWGTQGTAVPGPGAIACVGFVRLLSRRTQRR